MKEFNTTGCCNPERHYMVDTSKKLEQIEELVKKGKYFTINRARQFGKTTTFFSLLNRLCADNYVYLISFETDADMFSSDEDFCKGLFTKFSKSYNIPSTQKDFWATAPLCSNFEELSSLINDFCSNLDKPVVVMIDEADKNTDNQIFLHFLGMLRNMYLDRMTKGMNSTFKSVMLAGVYDVKNLKLKIRPEDERKYNSPWNVAVDFTVDMTFNPKEIETMLVDYEQDHHTGMDIQLIAKEIYKYTSGYPFLVSKICENIDSEYLLKKDWSEKGVQEAAKLIIKNDQCTLIDDLTKNIEIYPELKKLLRAMMLDGFSMPFEGNNPTLKLAKIFSILKADDEGNIAVHNLIFQQVLYNYFIAEKQLEGITKLGDAKSVYIQNGKLLMTRVIERFKDLMFSEHRERDNKFVESQGRLLFLCFLKPIINGAGFYYVEPQTRNDGRMDIVVTYGGEEFVIELKIWRGEKYEVEGKVQLAEYLASRNLNKGYLVTFSFLKNKTLQEAPEWISNNGKQIYETVI